MTAHIPPQTNPVGAAPARRPADATTGELVTRLSSQISELVRGELALAKAELARRASAPASVPAWPAPRACSPCTVSAPWSPP